VHIVDTGFLDAELLVASRPEFGVELLGPTRHDPRWQSRDAQGFGMESFEVDWERRQAICRAGHASSEWSRGLMCVVGKLSRNRRRLRHLIFQHCRDATFHSHYAYAPAVNLLPRRAITGSGDVVAGGGRTASCTR
jgi:hypothetical protein